MPKLSYKIKEGKIHNLKGLGGIIGIFLKEHDELTIKFNIFNLNYNKYNIIKLLLLKLDNIYLYFHL